MDTRIELHKNFKLSVRSPRGFKLFASFSRLFGVGFTHWLPLSSNLAFPGRKLHASRLSKVRFDGYICPMANLEGTYVRHHRFLAS
jgi:hypothetical protein